MKKYKTSLKGEFHVNQNEDYLVLEKIGNDKLLIAVLDGCSSAIESYFASALIGKILKKLAKQLDYKEFIHKDRKPLGAILKSIMKSLFEETNQLENQLDLNKYELPTTILIGLINTENRTAELLTVGDGLIYYNGKQLEYNQENQPDYIGYHLHENFEEWYSNQDQKVSLSGLGDLSISTDGIFSFKEFKLGKSILKSETELIELLLLNKDYSDNENMLKKKLFEIESNFNLKPSDDLSIIRIIWESVD